MARTPPVRTAGQRPLIAVIAVVVLASGVTSLVRSGDPLLPGRGGASEDGGAVDGPAGQPAPSPEAGRTAEVVGPAVGADVTAYVEDRTAALASAPDTVDTAVVSFSQRLLVTDAVAAVTAGADVRVRAVMVRLPMEQARPITVALAPGADPSTAVEEALTSVTQGLASEEEQLRELLDSGSVDDPAFEQDYRRRLQEVTDAQAAAGGAEPIVHAVVVRGPLAALQELQGATAVRLVDPAPPGTDIPTSTFHGLLPTDTGETSVGRAA